MNKLDAELAHVGEATLPYPLLKPPQDNGCYGANRINGNHGKN